MGEEIWNLLGNEDLITYAPWPKHDEAKLVLTKKQIGVQVLGKLRGTIEIDVDEDEESVKTKAFALETVARQLEGKTIVKVIYVKNKILNIVAK
jgi:leucyl-tRNA synthetase